MKPSDFPSGPEAEREAMEIVKRHLAEMEPQLRFQRKLYRSIAWGNFVKSPVGRFIGSVVIFVVSRAGLIVVLGAAYGAYHFLFGQGWLGTSVCLLIWFLLASLYVGVTRGKR